MNFTVLLSGVQTKQKNSKVELILLLQREKCFQQSGSLMEIILKHYTEFIMWDTIVQVSQDEIPPTKMLFKYQFYLIKSVTGDDATR